MLHSNHSGAVRVLTSASAREEARNWAWRAGEGSGNESSSAGSIVSHRRVEQRWKNDISPPFDCSARRDAS